MAIGMVDNLKGFAHSRPPLVIFMLCLGGFAVVLVTLAYYVKVKELTNPDITEDWNTFLKSLGDMEFCIAGNSTEYLAMTSPATSTSDAGSRSKRSVSQRAKASNVTSPAPVTSDWKGNVSVSVQMAVELQPTFDFLRIPHNVTHLSATVLGSQLGFAGDLADAELNVTMELPYEWNKTLCPRGTLCRTVTILTCVTMQAQAGIFPVTRRPVCNTTLDTGVPVEYWAQMVGRKTQDDPNRAYCAQRPLVRLQHELDHTLSIMLSMHDRSVINLHLMHTSYFLFVMVITLFCYALIKGRPGGRTVQYTDKVPIHT
ncbi:transmembrane protein 248-like isoform X2 [Liolophura sinensis]|uniref:transmembrane protein 248-like isoform X2 n=1 Tax=Liolophura sinensis TaxID=3198878 RepID=UPI00315943B2